MAKSIKTISKKVPLVSVVMSVYNCEKYVAESIESILSQTFTNFEFIIINDGSTDNTLKIIKEYKDPRLVLINRENKGLVASLNEGIGLAQGKYIARMDGDDISNATRLEKQVGYLRSDNSCVVLGTYIDEFNEVGSPVLRRVLSNAVTPGSLEMSLLVFNPLAHGSVMFRKNDFLAVGGYETSWFMVEDYQLWCKMATRGRLDVLPERLYGYRVSESGVSMANIDSQHQLAVKLQIEVLRDINSLLLPRNKYSYPSQFKRDISRRLIRKGKVSVYLRVVFLMRGSTQDVPRVVVVNNSTFVGGGEVYTKTLIEVLKGSADLVAVTSHRTVHSYLSKTGVRALLFKPLITSKRITQIIPFSYRINVFFLKVRTVLAGLSGYPVVHFQQPDSLYIDVLGVSRKKILTVHSNLSNLKDNQVLLAALNKVDKLITVAHAVSKGLVRQGVDKEKIVNIPNGITASALSALPISRRRDKVIWVGRIDSRDKNPGLFYEIAAKSQEVGLDIQFEFIGTGDMEKILKDKAASDRLRNITFSGYISDRVRIYKSAAVLCITSEREAFPLVMLEAMAAGVPILSTDVGDVKEVLGDRCIVPADPESFIKKIKSMKPGSSNYESLAERLRGQYASQYTAARMAKDTLSIYNKLR